MISKNDTFKKDFIDLIEKVRADSFGNFRADLTILLKNKVSQNYDLLVELIQTLPPASRNVVMHFLQEQLSNEIARNSSDAPPKIKSLANRKPITNIKANEHTEESKFVKEYVDYLRKKRGLSVDELLLAEKLSNGGPFSISRIDLNKYYKKIYGDQAGAGIKHSFLILPHNGELLIAAKDRGSLEGIIGAGKFGKVLGANLIIDGDVYCVKVFPKEGSEHEYNIMQHLGKKVWYFARSQEERDRVHKQTGIANTSWLDGKKVYDKAYLVQKVIPGVSLERIVYNDRDAQLLANRKFVLEIALSLAQELQRIHKKGVCHSDLHPGNVMVSYNTKTKSMVTEIMDFGLAKILEPKGQTKEKASQYNNDVEQLISILSGMGLQLNDYLPSTAYTAKNTASARTHLVRNIVTAEQSTTGSQENAMVSLEQIVSTLFETNQTHKQKMSSDQFQTPILIHLFLFNAQPNPSEQLIKQVAAEVVDAMKKNEEKNGKSAFAYNLDMLTNVLPPTLYIECCEILRNENPDIDNIMHDWSETGYAAALFGTQSRQESLNF